MAEWTPSQWVELVNGIWALGLPSMLVLLVGITAIRHGWPWCGGKKGD